MIISQGLCHFLLCLTTAADAIEKGGYRLCLSRDVTVLLHLRKAATVNDARSRALHTRAAQSYLYSFQESRFRLSSISWISESISSERIMNIINANLQATVKSSDPTLTDVITAK